MLERTLLNSGPIVDTEKTALLMAFNAFTSLDCVVSLEPTKRAQCNVLFGKRIRNQRLLKSDLARPAEMEAIEDGIHCVETG